MAPRVSIVIPARNDSAALARTLAHLARVVGIEESEVIVAGAGDREATEQAIAGRARLIWPGGATRSELQAVLGEKAPTNPADWTLKDAPQARALLDSVRAG